jgi:hypothetical protein
MLYYPQLATGATSQFPMSRRNQRRTVVNTMIDGSDIRAQDSGAAQVTWQLNYSHLTLSELSAIVQFHASVRGQLQTFTFVDPTDNLLNWSEDLAQPVWDADPMLQIVSGIADPFNGTGANQLTNTAQAAQQIVQTAAVAGTYLLCLSAYILSTQPSIVNLVASSGGASCQQAFTATASWSRVALPIELGVTSDGVTVGIQLPAGSQVSVFGLQLEAQPAPGGYKKTLDIAGVYAKSRLASDVLGTTATGFGQYSCQVSITSNVPG